MIPQVLAGKIGVVFGVANKRSIAWAIAKAWAAAGAKLIFNYQGERLKENVEELVGTFGAGTPLYPCDVTKDEDIARAYGSHANCYISKPVDLEQFLRVAHSIESFWLNFVKLPPHGADDVR